MTKSFYSSINKEVKSIKSDGLFKEERLISSPQGTKVTLNDGSEVLNFCANDYLGLASNQDVIMAAKNSLDEDGYGMASVRFICGTNNAHTRLEKELSEFLG